MLNETRVDVTDFQTLEPTMTPPPHIQQITSVLTGWGSEVGPSSVGTDVSLITSLFEKPALY